VRFKMNAHSIYRDRALTLQHRRFGPFEPGREIGALSNLFTTKSKKFQWQDRAILEKMICVVRGARGKQVYVYVQGQKNLIILRALTFLLTGIQTIKVFNSSDIISSADLTDDRNLIIRDVDNSIAESSHISLEGFLDECLCLGINLILLEADTSDQQEAILNRLSDNDRLFLIIRDFSMASTKFKASIFRKKGLTVTETADGFGELIAI
jgi:hypothetical protein